MALTNEEKEVLEQLSHEVVEAVEEILKKVTILPHGIQPYFDKPQIRRIAKHTEQEFMIAVRKIVDSPWIH